MCTLFNDEQAGSAFQTSWVDVPFRSQMINCYRLGLLRTSLAKRPQFSITSSTMLAWNWRRVRRVQGTKKEAEASMSSMTNDRIWCAFRVKPSGVRPLPVCHRSMATVCQTLLAKTSFHARHTQAGTVACFGKILRHLREYLWDERQVRHDEWRERKMGDGVMKLEDRIYEMRGVDA